MKKILYISSMFCLLLIGNSCVVDSEVSFLAEAEGLGFTGTQEQIEDFFQIDSGTFNELLNLGISINEGSTPPIIEGTFEVSPNELGSSNITSDIEDTPEGINIGDIFLDNVVTFSNQNEETRSISYSAQQLDGSGNPVNSSFGLESLISGNGDRFTVVIRISGSSTGSEDNPVTFITGVAISGSISSEGILSYQEAFVLTEKEGDTFDDFIDVGEGRRFIDSDGVADRQ